MSHDSPITFSLWQVLAEQVGKNEFQFFRLVGFRHDTSGKIADIAVMEIARCVVGLERNASNCLRPVEPVNLGTSDVAMPNPMDRSEVEARLSSRRWLQSSFDPCIPRIRSLDQIADEERRDFYQKGMRARLAMVRHMTANGWDIFVPARRSVIIESARAFEGIDSKHTALLHADTRLALTQFLAGGDPARSVVITHHAPSPKSAAIGKELDLISAAYVSDMHELIFERGPALWVHGHIHECRDYFIGKTRVLNNAFGYQAAAGPERTGFRPDLVVEV